MCVRACVSVCVCVYVCVRACALARACAKEDKYKDAKSFSIIDTKIRQQVTTT